MKSWGWFLLFILAILGSVYLWKRPEKPSQSPVIPAEVSPKPESAATGFTPPPAARNVPSPRKQERQPPGISEPPIMDQNGPGSPEIPPPPPSVAPMVTPPPDGEPPEYFDGDITPQPFEPPPPLEDLGNPESEGAL